MKKYTDFQWVNFLPKDGWHIISSPSSDHKAGFTYFPRERKKKGKKKSHNKVIQHDPFPTCVQLTAASLLFHLLCHRQMEN